MYWYKSKTNNSKYSIMKTLIKGITLILTSLILVSCFSGNEKRNIPIGKQQLAKNARINKQPTSLKQFKNSQDNKLVMKYFKDTSGAKVSRMPLPASWKVNPNYKDTLKIKAPNGITVSQKESLNFGYSEDKKNLQVLRDEGLIIEPVRSLKGIIQFITPKYNKIGYSFVKSYPVPTYEKILQSESNKIVIPGGKIIVSAVAIEFKGINNKKMLSVLVQSKTRIQGIDIWSLDLSKLIAPTEIFENAKSTYLYALDHIQINPEVIQKTNQEIKAGMQETARY